MTATGTEVGKTWVAAHLLERLRSRGDTVAARKPVQSFTPGEGPTDADVLAAAAGSESQQVCPPPRSYGVALAPPVAAARLGLPPFTIADLAAELNLPAEGITVVEGAGGWRSPLASDGDSRALAGAIHPDLIILVAPAALGAVHSVRSSLDTMPGYRVVVYLNHFDPGDDAAVATLDWLRDEDHLDVAVDIDKLLDLVENG